MTSEPAERANLENLEEILKEMLYRMDFADNYRLQKVVFYADVWCLQNFGKRLTDATFKPSNHGSYSDDITDALDELVEEGHVDHESVLQDDGPTRKYKSRQEGGQVSAAKTEILKLILDETGGLSSEELEHFSKQTWLFNNTAEGDTMDFEFYAENVVLAGPAVEGLPEREEDPLDGDDFESLIPP